MPVNNQSYPANPVLKVIKMLMEKMRQNPEIYPIRYYKKSSRFRRHWQGPLIK